MSEPCSHNLPAATAYQAASQYVIACSTCGRLFVCVEQVQDADGPQPFPHYAWTTLGWLADLRTKHIHSADDNLPITAL